MSRVAQSPIDAKTHLESSQNNQPCNPCFYFILGENHDVTLMSRAQFDSVKFFGGKYTFSKSLLFSSNVHKILVKMLIDLVIFLLNCRQITWLTLTKVSFEALSRSKTTNN